MNLIDTFSATEGRTTFWVVLPLVVGVVAAFELFDLAGGTRPVDFSPTPRAMGRQGVSIPLPQAVVAATAPAPATAATPADDDLYAAKRDAPIEEQPPTF